MLVSSDECLELAESATTYGAGCESVEPWLVAADGSDPIVGSWGSADEQFDRFMDNPVFRKELYRKINESDIAIAEGRVRSHDDVMRDLEYKILSGKWD